MHCIHARHAYPFVSCGADRNFKKGEKYLALGEYYDAAAQYKQAYTKTKAKEKALRGKYSARMAYCYDRINANGKAIAAYKNAIRYKADSLLMHVDYARTLLKNGNYKEAELEFKNVLDSMPNNQLAKDGLQSALTAKDIKDRGSRYIVKKMDIFNSRRADYSPMFCGDQYEQLFFLQHAMKPKVMNLVALRGPKTLIYSIHRKMTRDIGDVRRKLHPG